MSNNGQIKEKIESAVEHAIQKHGVHYDAMIPILLEINQQLGYIPVQSL